MCNVRWKHRSTTYDSEAKTCNTSRRTVSRASSQAGLHTVGRLLLQRQQKVTPALARTYNSRRAYTRNGSAFGITTAVFVITDSPPQTHFRMLTRITHICLLVMFTLSSINKRRSNNWYKVLDKVSSREGKESLLVVVFTNNALFISSIKIFIVFYINYRRYMSVYMYTTYMN